MVVVARRALAAARHARSTAAAGGRGPTAEKEEGEEAAEGPATLYSNKFYRGGWGVRQTGLCRGLE